jgi:hypothetical protein
MNNKTSKTINTINYPLISTSTLSSVSRSVEVLSDVSVLAVALISLGLGVEVSGTGKMSINIPFLRRSEEELVLMAHTESCPYTYT